MPREPSARLQPIAALAAGGLFGLGLCISGMVNPAKVLAFLDIAGAWDPTLAFVMAGALAIALPGFRWAAERTRPWLAPRFEVPRRTDIDGALMLGASLFGIGWGLVGLCPGPAVTALVSGENAVLAFVAAMLAGFWLHDLLRARTSAAREAQRNAC